MGASYKRKNSVGYEYVFKTGWILLKPQLKSRAYKNAENHKKSEEVEQFTVTTGQSKRIILKINS